ncbi:MAG: helix-turn-helix transcriptional regulator [Victivallales bacterium]
MLSRRSELVRAAQELITTHLDRSLDLEAIAGELHVSREHLSRVFTAQTGISPGAFATQERMHLAGRLLRDRNLNCKDIAARLGFESASSFARAFRTHYKVSPTQYLNS